MKLEQVNRKVKWNPTEMIKTIFLDEAKVVIETRIVFSDFGLLNPTSSYYVETSCLDKDGSAQSKFSYQFSEL